MAYESKDKCAKFLELSERSQEGFTIRNIDETIHELIRDRAGYVTKSPAAYKDKQMRLIELIKGCEVQIFNDPNVLYPDRPHLNGIAGTMSNILTGTFYYLYHYLLLNTPVIVNAKEDLITLMYTGLCIDYTKIPSDDKLIIQEIIKILLTRLEDRELATKLISNDWWNELIDFINVYSASHPLINMSPHSKSIALQSYRAFQEFFVAEFKEPNNIWNNGPYDDIVDYVVYRDNIWSTILDDDILYVWIRKIKKTKSLFIPAEINAYNINLMGGGRSVKKNRRGSNKKMRTRKFKRKTLRRRSN
jgi:hypothetical protein